MKRIAATAFAVLAGIGLLSVAAQPASAAEPPADVVDEDPFEKQEADEPVPPIADPLRPVNRGVFVFNDKLYFWVLRPAARGYKIVVPEIARVRVRMFFHNVAMPVRMVNCLLQADLKGTGAELARFGLNTTVGIVGFSDPAEAWLELRPNDEDFGQTLGVWGMGQVCYINWPIVGPSSLRDTLAFPLNAGLDPMTYVPGVGLLRTINNTSLRLGDYEDLKAGALDPYIAVRDAYNQHRRHAVRARR